MWFENMQDIYMLMNRVILSKKNHIAVIGYIQGNDSAGVDPGGFLLVRRYRSNEAQLYLPAPKNIDNITRFETDFLRVTAFKHSWTLPHTGEIAAVDKVHFHVIHPLGNAFMAGRGTSTGTSCM